MALKLMYITNDVCVAQIAESNGVDWVFVDLEIRGKEERQGHLDTVISGHAVTDVRKIAAVLKKAKLLVRVNPIYPDSGDEIDKVIENGADIVMLPFFRSVEEVRTFIKLVGGRAETCLLLETVESVDGLDLILKERGIDYIHIGLNDLHLGYGMKFMFELLTNGTVESICEKIRTTGIPFGFGGIARLGEGAVPAEYIIAEHYRLGSSMAILSRSFCDCSKMDSLEEVSEVFKQGIREIRDYELYLSDQGEDFYGSNVRKLTRCVADVVDHFGRSAESRSLR